MSGCAATGRDASPLGGGPGPVFASQPGVVQVVLVRPVGDRVGVLNVFRVGRFHAALTPGGFTVLSLCSSDDGFEVTSFDGPRDDDGRFLARLLRVRQPFIGDGPHIYEVALQKSGAVRAKLVQSSAVNWGGLLEEGRTISRAVHACGDKTAPLPVADSPAATPPLIVAAPVSPAPQEAGGRVITLAIPSDLLFPFAGYSVNAVPGSAQARRLERFLRDLGARDIESLLVKGHSDPVGRPYDKALVSEARANAVAAYLGRELRLPSSSIQVQGLSDKELLVPHCPAQPAAIRDACNAPNRRVEIVVTVRR